MANRRKYLQIALLVFGIIALLLYPLMLFLALGLGFLDAGSARVRADDEWHLRHPWGVSDLGLCANLKLI